MSPQKTADSPTYPVVANIHQRILAAVNNGENLRMNGWHSCGTTHCRGGWAIKLAGKAGKALEKRTSSEFAAMMIFKASSKIEVPPTRFYETDKKAMEDIRRCAELEQAEKGGAK